MEYTWLHRDRLTIFIMSHCTNVLNNFQNSQVLKLFIKFLASYKWGHSYVNCILYIREADWVRKEGENRPLEARAWACGRGLCQNPAPQSRRWRSLVADPGGTCGRRGARVVRPLSGSSPPAPANTCTKHAFVIEDDNKFKQLLKQLFKLWTELLTRNAWHCVSPQRGPVREISLHVQTAHMRDSLTSKLPEETW